MRLWNEKRRFAVVPAGRRSGKTELAKRRLVLMLPEKKEWPDARYFAAAPTRAQAKRIFWNDLKALIPGKWIRRIYETELCVTTIFGSELWVLGLDKPQRIEGTPWDGGVLDEYADMKPEAWSVNVRPALADRSGWCWFIGVPEGLNHYKDLVDYAASGVDEDWGLYTWKSSDVVSKAEVEAARRVLDPRTFRQEYEASFEGRAGRAYYAYDAKTHIDASIELDETLPIIVCCDFNVDPCVWVLAQYDKGVVRVFDEIGLNDTNTQAMCRELLRRYEGHRAGFIVHGDAAGSARSTAGSSDYAIMAGMGFCDQRLKKSNPVVRDRVNAINGILRNAANEIRLTHHPRCIRLRKDLENVGWSADGREIDKTRPELTHASDALGYFIAAEFALKAPRSNPAKRFYK